jgi:hypothetical protein
MSITNIKVAYLYEPDAARERILETFSQCGGSMKATADALGCHYATLLRLIKKDSELADGVLREREALHNAGIQQRGFGVYQREAIEPV